MTQMGVRMNLTRPQSPWYLDTQPALQTRTPYSTPKKNTSNIS